LAGSSIHVSTQPRVSVKLLDRYTGYRQGCDGCSCTACRATPHAAGFILRLRSLLSADAPPLKLGSPPLDLCLSYLAHAGIGALIWWLQEEQPHSPEQIATWLNQLNKDTFENALHSSMPR